MDPKDIFRTSQLLDFWPTSKQSAKDRVNATARFVLYSTCIIYVINRDSRVFALGLLVLALLYYMYTMNMIVDGRVRPTIADGRIPGPFREGLTMPSRDNPMANVLMSDYVDYPDRPTAAWNPSVRGDVQAQWSKIHPFENTRNAERNFYTVASTTIPNDQNAFAQASYGRQFKPVCKDQGGDACDVDSPSFMFPERVQLRGGNGR